MSGLTGVFDNRSTGCREMYRDGVRLAVMASYYCDRLNGKVHTLGQKFGRFGTMTPLLIVDGMRCIPALDFIDSAPTDFYTLLHYQRQANEKRHRV